MSRILIPFHCEQCGRMHKKAVYDGVDVSKEPQYRAKVMDASIFDFVCPSCGYVNGIIYPFLYHDRARRFMVQLVDSSVTNDPFVDIFSGSTPQEEAMRQVAENMKLTYRLRTVRTPNDLMEKISMFEAGYDDRALECMKAELIAKDPGIEHLYYAPTDSGPVFLVEEEAGFTRSIPIDSSAYETALARVQQLDDHETEIDQNWAARIRTQA